MLRASAENTGRKATTSAAATDADPELEGGRAIVAFVDALVCSTTHVDPALVKARDALIDVVGGPPAARAATTAGNFEMMNRLLDAAGVPVPDPMLEVGRQLGVLRE